MPEWKTWSAAGDETTLYLDATKKDDNIKMGKKEFTYADVLDAIEKDTSVPTDRKQVLISQVLNGRWFSHGLDEKYNNLSEFDK